MKVCGATQLLWRARRWTVWAVGVAIALAFPALASATVLPEKITENTTLTVSGSPYTGSTTIEPGATLTIQPGVVLKLYNMIVKGTLDAEGTASQPVVFTGAKEEKAGEWCSIYLEPGGGASVLNHTEVKYGGACGGGEIRVSKSSPTIENSTISHSSAAGIEAAEGGSPHIAENLFASNSGTAVYYHAYSYQSGAVDIHGNQIEGGASGISVSIEGSAPVTGESLGGNTITGTTGTSLSYAGPDIPGNVTGNALSGNKNNFITVGGTVAHSEAWGNAGTPLKTSEAITVAAGATLTIQPGVVLKLYNMIVKGTLDAEGTASQPVVFTGAKEEKAGEWCSIYFEPGGGASVLNHTEVKYGGACGGGEIRVSKSSPTIENSTISHASGGGIEAAEGGGLHIAENRFAANGGTNIYYHAYSSQSGAVDIHGNQIEGGPSGISVSIEGSAPVTGESLGGNTITGTTGTALSYSGPDIPSGVTANSLSANANNFISVSGTVAHSETWTYPGVPVHIGTGGVAVASGALLSLGVGLQLMNPAMNVRGTLVAEGTEKEPVRLVGEAQKAGGEWSAIRFESGSGSSSLEYVELGYGGRSSIGMIEIIGSHPKIVNSTLRKSSSYGITVTESGSPTIERDRFRSNSNGLYYSGTGKLSAPHNDWGCASGPKPAGCGDAVSGNVEWRPAANELKELGGHCRGKESQCPEGADPVSLATGQLDYSHRDLLLTNKSAVPLEFARSYTSGSEADTGLGPGWAQSGLASASELEGGEVLVVRPDGRQDAFKKTEAGYEAPSGVTDTLAKVEGTFQLTTLEGTVYRFDASGRIASITDDHGLKTTYAYNAEGRLATITDPSAQTLTFAYNASNHITSVKDSTGREVKFAYSAAGDLESVTDALGGVTKYAYDAQHRLTSITDPRGHVILKNTYNAEGKVTEQEDGLGHLWKIEYKPGETIVTEPTGGKRSYGFDGLDRITSETDQLGHTTTIAYDAAGNVSEVLQPGAARWKFGHDAAGNLTSVTDPEGGERKYEYNARNQLTHFIDARGSSWAYEWSPSNDLTKVTDPEGGETSFTYNESGQPLTETDPDKHKTEFGYDTRGNRTSLTDPLGHKTSYEFNSANYLIAKTAPGLKAEKLERDALGDLLARTTPEGHTTKYAYDANGLPTQVTDPAEDVWKIERNAMERPTAYVDPAGKEIKLTYNGDLKPISMVNRRGIETTYGYNAADELTEVNGPEGGHWRYGYDARGNRTSVIDPREHETTYEYDLLNRLRKASEPLGVTSEYGYDANGDLTSVKDPRANTTTYGYDKLGRLSEVAQPLEKTTTYGYDPAGNLLKRTTAAGALEYGYDAANRLTEIKSGEATLRSYGYDADNRKTSATDAAGHKIEIAYNEDGLPSSIKDGRGQSLTRSYNSRDELTKQEDPRGTLEYGYDKLGRLTSLVDPQGKTLEFGYDPEGDLTEVKRPGAIDTTSVFNEAGRLAETATSAGEPPATLESLKYGYDPAGNVTSRLDRRLEQETTYAYDALNRLSEFNPPGEGATTYGYDKAGNRTEAGGTTYSYNALNQLTESSAGTTYSYDGAGRMTGMVNGSEKTTYEWEPLEHLAKVEGPGGTESYAYDGLERLSERKAGAETSVSHYGDLSDMPSYLSNGEGKTMRSYVQGARGLVEQRAGEATSFPLTDAHGDLTALLGSGGEVESRDSYGPWGEVLSGPSLEMGYLGAFERPADAATGLIQMGARSYAPSLGVFLSEDPVMGHIGIGSSVDRYVYVRDNPLSVYDLNGRDSCLPTPLGEACSSGAVGAIKGTVEEAERGWGYVEEGGSAVGAAVGSTAESAWTWSQPGRQWIGERGRDFWKEYGSALERIYRFAGENWQKCVEGGRAGAAGGAVAGLLVGPEGSPPGALAGGGVGCAGTVLVNALL